MSKMGGTRLSITGANGRSLGAGLFVGLLVLCAALAMEASASAMEEMYKNYLVLPSEGAEGIADPHFLRYNGRYYLYPTAGRDMYVKAWVSEDLVNWRYLGTVTAQDSSILRVWGPHVKYWNGAFYMYINVPGNSEGDNAQYVLRADNPTGPFIRQTDNLGLRLSPTVFVDDDHQWYIFHAGKDGVVGYAMDDPYTLRRPGRILGAQMDFWTEGPKMFKRNDVYYLVFTGDHWLSRGYREAYATSEDGPLGTFAMADNNPMVISTEDDHYGLGNGYVLRGPDLDSYYFLYHSLMRAGAGNTRKLNVDPVVFNGKRMSVLGPTNYPQPLPPMPDFYTWLDEDGTDGWKAAEFGGLTLITSPEVTERYYTAEFNFHTEAPADGLIGVVFSYQDEGNFYYAVVRTAEARLEAYAVEGGSVRLLQSAGLPPEFDFSKLHTIRVENGEKLKIFFDEMKKIELPAAGRGGRIGYAYQSVEPVLRFTAFSNKVNGSAAGAALKPVPGRFEAVHVSATSDATWNPHVLHESASVAALPDGTYAVALDAGAWVEFALNVKRAGRYALDLVASGPVDDVRVEVAVDGESRGVFDLVSHYNGFATARLGLIDLGQGKHTLRLRGVEGRALVSQLELYEAAEELPGWEGRTVEARHFNVYGPANWRSGPLGYSTGINGDAFVVFGDPSWTDYKLAADITVDPGVDLGTQGAGLLLRVTHPSYHERQSFDPMMGYYVELQNQRIVLKRLSYGSEIVGVADAAIQPGKAHRLAAVVRGNLVQVYLDDDSRPVLEYYDPRAYMHGAAGLRTHRSGVHFGNVTVSALDAPPAVRILSPLPGAKVGAESRVRVVSSAPLAAVRMLLDGEPVYEGVELPRDFVLRGADLEAGQHLLEVEGEDAAGAVHRHAVSFVVEHARLVSPGAWGAQVGEAQPIVVELAVNQGDIGSVSIALRPAAGAGQAVTLYEGAKVPGPVIPDPLEVADGAYDLVVRVSTASGKVSELVQRVVLDNWNELEDAVQAPVSAGWFGVVDRMKTVDRSGGWEYAGGEADAFFGDTDRIRRAGAGSAYLTWELAGVRQFEFRVFAREPRVDSAVKVSVSADGSTWKDVAYAVRAEGPSDAGWWRLTLIGAVPEGELGRFVRLRFSGDGTEAGLQLGHVILRAPRD